VLPNAWDVASARLVVKAGFPVVATSSGAISTTLGYEDNDSMPVDEAFGVIARIARSVSVPVTADVEAGYRLSPTELVERLLDAGAVGCNLEDSDHHDAPAYSTPTRTPSVCAQSDERRVRPAWRSLSTRAWTSCSRRASDASCSKRRCGARDSTFRLELIASFRTGCPTRR
jgi:2-methylisocitrate lyase-like PEP mutase family enzyme